MINKTDFIIIFAPFLRGNGQRRGAPRERSRMDKGRLVIACLFDPRRIQFEKTESYFFLWVFLGYFDWIDTTHTVKDN